MTDAERIIEIEIELAEITLKMSELRKIGQGYKIDTGSSIREVDNVKYSELRAHYKELKRELAGLEGESGLTMQAGW